LKIAVAQLNSFVGDVEGNLEKIIKVIKEIGLNADLIITPELFLTGYPPWDLLEKSWFMNKTKKAVEKLKEISKEFPETGILTGAPTYARSGIGKNLYNSALLISKGKLLFQQDKSLLPTYDVFDEARYFIPAPEINVISFKGEKLGITICEDVWNNPDLWPEKLMYDFDPVEELVEKGATLLVNISASPFHVDKERVRYKLLKDHAQKNKIPLVFVNQVGGNDELIFDGRSMGFDKKGEPVFIFPSFKEKTELIDMKGRGIPGLYIPQDKRESIYQALVLGTRDYLKKSGFSRAILGLSGGIDSAVTCCIAVDALGKENVSGISMPSPYSSRGSVEDSKKLARNLGIDFKVIDISQIYYSYLNNLKDHFMGQGEDVTEENIQARIRGNILMAFSNKLGHLVLVTGNKSEISVGYCTLYGDMAGGLSVLSDVPKKEVFSLARYINRKKEVIPEEIIVKAPSAELKPGQLDEDTLPPYEVLDQVLNYYVEEGYSAEEIISLGLDPEMVKWIIRAVDKNEYKRKQSPPGLRVTTKAYGVGRKMPIAAKHYY